MAPRPRNNRVRRTVRTAAGWLLLALTTLVPLAATAEQGAFSRLGLSEGLSQSTVFGIAQDRRGFLWFATRDGLNRYDGYRFTTHRHDDRVEGSIAANFLWSLHRDRAGRLWAGTQGGGLNRYDPEHGRFIHYRHDPADPGSLSSDVVVTLADDHAGRLWVGTEGGGLNRLDRPDGPFTRYLHDPADPRSLGGSQVWAIHEDRVRRLWVGTADGGLNLLDPEGEAGFRRFRHDPDDSASLSLDAVWALEEDTAGRLWVGTFGGGLDRLEWRADGSAAFIHHRHDPNDPHSLPNDFVWTVMEDRAGRLWVGTNNGLGRYDPERKRFDNFLPGRQIKSLFEDDSGILWVGTFFEGLYKLDRFGKKFELHRHAPNNRDTLANDVVYGIHEDDEGLLWVATNGGGLNHMDLELGEVEHYRHDPNDPETLAGDALLSLTIGRDGSVWTGGFTAGLNHLDPESGRVTRHLPDAGNPHAINDNTVFAILEDRTGAVWAGTWKGGLNRLDPAAGRFSHFRHDPNDPTSLAADFVQTLFEDRSGRLWVGTAGGGLDRFDPALNDGRGGFTHYPPDPTDPFALHGSHVYAIHEDEQGLLWVGTDTGGLNRLDPKTGRVNHVTEAHGLPSPTVLGIVDDGLGHLWLSTKNGLARLHLASGKVRAYDQADGVQSREFIGGAAHRGADGTLYFGGVAGLNAFRPEAIRENPFRPPVALTSFKIFNREAAIGRDIATLDAVTLTHQDNVISFEFAALSFTHPEKNRYRYRMEGLDPDWNDTDGRRFVMYNNLPPGSYRFRVKGSNHDGVWNEEGLTLAIEVLPPWWSSWWAWLLYVLAALGLVAGYVRLKTHSQAAEMERQRHELERERDAAEQVRRAEEKYRQLFDSAAEGLFQLDPEGRAVSANRALAEILGYPSPEELMEAAEPLPARLFDEPRRDQLMERLRRDGRLGGEAGEVTLADGTKRWVVFSARAVLDETTRELAHYDGVLADVTALKARESAERAAADAEQASEAKSQFLAAMSHEIRTPMNGVMGFTELLAKSGLDEAQRSYVETISRSSANLLAIINDILDFSKLEAGQMTIDQIPFDLQEVVDEVMVLLAPNAMKKGLELAAVVDPAIPPRILGDPQRTRQVLTNLVGNALKFTHQGEVRLHAELLSEDERGYRLAIAVEDSGIGIDADAVEGLFQPFTQADASVTRQYGGSGLGLAICRGLVEGMGGTIGVESEPGRGSTFHFTLHCAPDTLTPRPDPLLEGRRVVVWEARDTLREGIVAALRRWGVEAHGCTDEAGWRALADDAELLLRGLPEGEEEAAVRALEFIGVTQPLGLLAATFERARLDQLAAEGARFALSKPIRFAALREELKRLWSDRPEPAAATTGDAPAKGLSLSGLRILVVDDNEVNRLLATTLLANRGVQVAEAESGEEAVRMVVEGPRFDAILMDIQMPGMSGIEATEEIRRRQTTGEPTPIIALTAHALPHEREQFLASGMEDFLSKPLSEKDLWSVLSEWVVIPTTPTSIQASPTPPASTAQVPETTMPSTTDQAPTPAPTPAPDNSALPAYDRPQALAITGGNEALADRLLAMFRDTLPEAREQILVTRAMGDNDALLKAVHKLHGAAANCGAIALERTSDALEAVLKGSEGDEREEALVRELLAEIERFPAA